jgi:hypothetical protein
LDKITLVVGIVNCHILFVDECWLLWMFYGGYVSITHALILMLLLLCLQVQQRLSGVN